MTDSNFQFLYRITVSILIFVLATWLVFNYLEKEKQSYLQYIDSEIYAVESDLLQVVSGAAELEYQYVPATKILFTRCDRQQMQIYEQSLAQLGTGLSDDVLDELAVWFDRCGLQQSESHIIRADTVAAHVAQLERLYGMRSRVESLADDTAQRLEIWEQYAIQLVSYAEMQLALDELQRDLIIARRDGLPVDGPAIRGILDTVQAERQRLSDQAETNRELYDRLTL